MSGAMGILLESLKHILEISDPSVRIRFKDLFYLSSVTLIFFVSFIYEQDK
jgi:hypothetical protein